MKAHELAPDAAIDSNPAGRVYDDVLKDVPEATSNDIEWADAIIFGIPTRFGIMVTQIKQFIDSQDGLWANG